jgi:MFS family permease
MSEIRKTILGRVSKRLIPLLFLLYLFSYVDRVNIGYAALQMNSDLGFNPAVFGLGAGLLFLGYFAFGIPSNFILRKVGGRAWLSFLAIVWGAIAVANSIIATENMFYVMRFLLGVAESGFVPGMLLYLTVWYPQSERAKVVSTMYMATAVSVVLAGPLSGAILQLDGAIGISGWRWILILEGVPPIVLGIWAWLALPERPDTVDWLSDGERKWLANEIETDREVPKDLGYDTFRKAIRAPIVWVFGLVYFLLGIGFFSVMIWLPQLIKQISALTTAQVSFVSAIPFICASVCMVLYGKHSDKTKERQGHLGLALLVGAGGLIASASFSNPIAALAALCFAAMGLWSATGVFWPMPTAFLSGGGAVGGLALINSIGILGGFAGPYIVGIVRNLTPNFSAALYCVAAAVLTGALIVSQLHRSAVVRAIRDQAQNSNLLQGQTNAI